MANEEILGRPKDLGGPGISASNTGTHPGIKTTETEAIRTETRGPEPHAASKATKTSPETSNSTAATAAKRASTRRGKTQEIG